MSMFSKKQSKGGGNAGNARKGGRPKIPQVEGCTIEDGWSGDRHVYTMFGKPQESCVKCGKEHAEITAWRTRLAEGKGWEDHPFVKHGYWSNVEYKKYMKK